MTFDVIRDAGEQLVLRRDTHLDQLADKLREERVRRVVEPLLSGETPAGGIPDDDVDYARDLGLIARDGPIRIANPIYREIVPRQLVYGDQDFLNQETAWYVDPQSGRLRADKLLAAFQTFFREHSEHWLERYQYREAGPQLLLQAFLQRVVNSGGRIEREYGLGRMRTDLLVVWPEARTGSEATPQRIVIECKIRHGSSGRHHRRGAGADPRIHGSLRGRGRPPDRIRPIVETVARQGVPARGDQRWRDGHNLGNVGAVRVRKPDVAEGAAIVQGMSRDPGPESCPRGINIGVRLGGPENASRRSSSAPLRQTNTTIAPSESALSGGLLEAVTAG